MTALLFYRFAAALLIGMLIGLQREHDSEGIPDREKETFAGVRTFALLGLAGCLVAYVTEQLDTPLAFVGLFLLLGGLIASGYWVTALRGSAGMTTEMAALTTLFVGALCYWGELPLAAALGVITTALLSFKPELHTLAKRLTQEDVVATLKFAIVAAVVLPLLPNASPIATPPFDVLNPYKIGLMIVLISGISFLGYVLIKAVGSTRGIGLTGVLGGLASSTAVTLSFAQRSHKEKQFTNAFALAIILSWAVMFSRVLVEVATVNRDLLPLVWLPITAAGGVGLIYAGYLYYSPHQSEANDVQFSNPFEMGTAIRFGLLYGVILLVARAAQLYFGEAGIYLSSIVSGLADVDAITLTLAELSRQGAVQAGTASRAIVLAAMSNTLVKGMMVFSLSIKSLRQKILPGMGLILAVGVGLVFFI